MAHDPVKHAFAERLRLALRKSGATINGPTDLALQFNLRHRGGNAISIQAAHKWLTGRALPRRDKIETLCGWLDVSEVWLVYGLTTAKSAGAHGGNNKELSQDAGALASSIEVLTSHQRYLLEALVREFRQTIKSK